MSKAKRCPLKATGKDFEMDDDPWCDEEECAWWVVIKNGLGDELDSRCAVFDIAIELTGIASR